MGVAHGGQPVMLPSDIESLVSTYGLTPPEAETVWHRMHGAGEDEATAVETVKRRRVVYRPAYDKVPGA